MGICNTLEGFRGLYGSGWVSMAFTGAGCAQRGFSGGFEGYSGLKGFTEV